MQKKSKEKIVKAWVVLKYNRFYVVSEKNPKYNLFIKAANSHKSVFTWTPCEIHYKLT